MNRETLEETRALIKEKKKKKKKLNSSTRRRRRRALRIREGGREREGERQFRPRDERTRHGNSIEHAVIGN